MDREFVSLNNINHIRNIQYTFHGGKHNQFYTRTTKVCRHIPNLFLNIHIEIYDVLLIMFITTLMKE